MSLVIQKFEPGGKTTQPRLYKRGNDDIDLDAYIRNAESEFSYWLANSRLKDKEKQQVQQAYSQMIQGINDGTFTYKIGGGYNNSIGMSNTTKGFDAAGLAAGFLGNVLRNQSVYQAPEEKPDPSKIEWKGNSSVGSALVRHLYGSDKESLNDFIDLDPYDTKTKKRGNANRSARFKSGLEYVRDNFDNLFTSFSDADKASALEGITSALAAFDNGTVEDNEYLDLGRATGMSNLRDMFFSGEKYGGDSAAPSAKPGTQGVEGTYTDENEWRSAKYPRLSTKIANPISLNDATVYGLWSRNALYNHLKKLPDLTLFDLVNYGLSKNVKLYLNPKIVSYAGMGNNPVPFTNKYIISTILKILKYDKNALSLYSDSSGNQIYIHGSYDKKRGTGLVWNIGDNTINEFNVYDIPWWVTKMHNEFTSLIPANKNGGLLRKFATGGVSNVGYNADTYSWDDIIYGSNQFATVLGGLNLKNYQAANDLQNRYYTDRINDKWNDGTLKKRDLVSKYQTDFNTAYGVNLNLGAIEDAISAGKITRAGTTGDDLKGNYTDGYSGAMTNLRHLGTSDHVKYLAEMNKLLNPNGLEAFLNEETNMINYRPLEDPVAARKDVVASTTSPDAVSADELFGKTPTEEHTDAWKKVFGLNAGSDSVDEKYLPAVDITPKNGSFGSFMADLAPDLIGAGRLWASLHTNNRVYDTVLPSLKPILKNTFERYSPVTGAFSAMQLKNRQGADVMRQSNQAFTSDASLAAARMLEGLRQSNLLQAEGFLADDQEIRRTQAEALARLEDNMARRSEVANFNRASINLTNRERAQLEATRLKSNWQSWDNFLQGFESRIRTRMDENRERANNFYDKLSANQAEEWYNTSMEPANRALDAWSKHRDNVGKDITEWPEWQNYVKHKERARAMANAMIYQSMADRYGLSYSNPYTRESYSLMDWNRRYV